MWAAPTTQPVNNKNSALHQAIKAGDVTVHDGRCWHRVERSKLVGVESRRRVMYVPIIAGKYDPKRADSPTPFYHRFHHLVK